MAGAILSAIGRVWHVFKNFLAANVVFGIMLALLVILLIILIIYLVYLLFKREDKEDNPPDNQQK
jgi:uncharacterized membrane protein YukC